MVWVVDELVVSPPGSWLQAASAPGKATMPAAPPRARRKRRRFIIVCNVKAEAPSFNSRASGRANGRLITLFGVLWTIPLLSPGCPRAYSPRRPSQPILREEPLLESPRATRSSSCISSKKVPFLELSTKRFESPGKGYGKKRLTAGAPVGEEPWVLAEGKKGRTGGGAKRRLGMG